MPATNRCHCHGDGPCDHCEAIEEQHQDRINEAREESEMQAMEMRYERELDDRW